MTDRRVTSTKQDELIEYAKRDRIYRNDVLQSKLPVFDTIIRKIERYKFEHPRRGPTPQSRRVPVIMFVANSKRQLARVIRTHAKAVGLKARGNKRIGRRELYAELIMHFIFLRQHRVTLPRNKSLSRAACEFGLGDILRRHRCTEFSEHDLPNSAAKRAVIAAKMDRAFSRVAWAIDETPA